MKWVLQKFFIMIILFAGRPTACEMGDFSYNFAYLLAIPLYVKWVF